ncbi:hypothetical protein [Candidatus Methylomicrobium oryzae]|jgi:hypothetical protein|uniref:hypothetical protein n=1 Tax=Candidatus Methylomicrobium oryzae TaxID=2802053 RepID=UPI0019210BE0|nr:hypothetical protein [Methylomicrobium sp. RS1]MBL1265427.1 hypothetical protein [Methylomicrobium sp. RS1]
MKLILRLAVYSLFTVLALCVAIVLFGVGNKPDVIGLGWELTHNDIARAKKILHEGAQVKPDELDTIELTESDLNLAANYLLNRYWKSAVHIQLKDHKLRFNVTATLPDNPLGKFLNVSFRLGNDSIGELPGITKFKVGKLLLPARFAAWVIERVIQNSSLREYYLLATHPIEAVEINDEKVSITYFSSAETLRQARNFLADSSANPEQALYKTKLAEIVANHDPEWRLSLAELLQPMFQLAFNRSTPESAIEENRLVIFAVNDYVNKHQIPKLLDATDLKTAEKPQYSAFMYKRIDLAQHFIGAAALTASVNGKLAKVMGEQKELSDADGGSGFSFIDLAADKAGTRFGEIATSTPENARKIQKAMSTIRSYSEFMPDPRDLPEKMSAEEFRKRFGAINSPEYQKISKEIDARITALSIYRIQNNK